MFVNSYFQLVPERVQVGIGKVSGSPIARKEWRLINAAIPAVALSRLVDVSFTSQAAPHRPASCRRADMPGRGLKQRTLATTLLGIGATDVRMKR